ncbi:MAG: broad specificity phosphatase PhoE [Cellvibrionaceae bacterium]|jgi:broad specificity phosphatase PhoE
MKPKRIILVRHGESEGNIDKSVYEHMPDYTLNLTKKGHQQAADAGQEIAKIIGSEKIQAYVSPYYRTRQTFDGIAKAITPNLNEVIEDPRIREQEYGHLRPLEEGQEIKQERRDYGKFYFRIPDGESGADVFDRISTFLETLHRAFNRPDFPPNVLIVTHGMSLRIFLMRWYRMKVETFEDLRNPRNCQIVLMEQTETGQYDLVRGLKERDESKS